MEYEITKKKEPKRKNQKEKSLERAKEITKERSLERATTTTTKLVKTSSKIVLTFF